MARRGYNETRIADIAQAARVSLSTFYEHFEGKQAALAAAIDSGQARMMALGLPAFRRAREWPAAVRSALTAIFRFLAAEADLARLVTVEAYAAGPEAHKLTDDTIRGLETILAPGLEHAPELPRLTPESVASALYAMVHQQVQHGGAERLPELAPLATHMALVPFLGPEAAWEAARGRRMAR